MRDTAYVFTIFFLTLGPLKIIPTFAAATRGQGTVERLKVAIKASLVATVLALAIFYGGNHVVIAWRLSTNAIAIAGGTLLFVTALKTITTFSLAEMPPGGPGDDFQRRPAHGWRTLFGSLAPPVLSPIAIPATITPIGVVALFYFSAVTSGDAAYQADILIVLLQIMALNFVAMTLAPAILQVIGLPVLQAIGWVMSALQAALAVQIVLAALRRLQVLP